MAKIITHPKEYHYGFKGHIICDVETELPIAYTPQSRLFKTVSLLAPSSSYIIILL